MNVLRIRVAIANNRRARSFHARQGYQEDSLRLTKPLSK